MRLFGMGDNPLTPNQAKAWYTVWENHQNEWYVDFTKLDSAEKERKLALHPPALPWENGYEKASVSSLTH